MNYKERIQLPCKVKIREPDTSRPISALITHITSTHYFVQFEEVSSFSQNSDKEEQKIEKQKFEKHFIEFGEGIDSDLETALILNDTKKRA